MKFGTKLGFVEDDQLIEAAQFCEELGFDTVALSDHLFIPEVIRSRYPGTKRQDGQPFFTIEKKWSFPDPFVGLGVIAGSTRHIELMQSIYILPARNPIEVAKATGTLATLAPGRFHLCPAVGWMKEEFDVYDVEFDTRGRRADEMIDILRKLWSGEIVEHHGEFFDFPRLRVLPAPGHVPIIPSGSARIVKRRAARLGDGWMNMSNKIANMPRIIAELNEMRREAGRDHLPFDIVTILVDKWEPGIIRQAEEMGITTILLPPTVFALGGRTTLDEKKRHWETFAEKVMRHFTKSGQ